MKRILFTMLLFSTSLFAQWDGTTNKTVRESDLFGPLFEQALDSSSGGGDGAVDTTSLSNRIDLKLNIVDSTGTGYATQYDLTLIAPDSTDWATQYDLSLIDNRLGTINKTAYDILDPTVEDTFMIFWIDDGLKIDSVKCISEDSIGMQVKIVGVSTTNLFLSAVIVNGTTTLSSFDDDSFATNDKVYLYFTIIGDTIERLRLKFYWSYL